MIFKLTFDDKQEFATAKDHLNLLQSYDEEYEGFHDITDLEEISDEEAKKELVRNTEYSEDDPDEMPEEISLYDLAVGDDFAIIASTEY